MSMFKSSSSFFFTLRQNKLERLFTTRVTKKLNKILPNILENVAKNGSQNWIQNCSQNIKSQTESLKHLHPTAFNVKISTSNHVFNRLFSWKCKYMLKYKVVKHQNFGRSGHTA